MVWVFFMPYVHWLLIRMLQKPEDERTRILLAGFFFVFMLQGSVHIFVWWIIFFCIMVILKPKLFRPVFCVLVLATGLNLFRFLPSGVSLYDTELHFLSGYHSLGWLLDGLTVIQPVDWLDDGTHSGIRWWELDIYVGIAGLVLLAYFGIVRVFFIQDKKELRILEYASFCMSLLCFVGVLVAIATILPIPLFTSQRVATRLIVIPLTTCIVLGAIGMEDTLRVRQRDLIVRIILLFLLVLVTYDRCRHSLTWQIARLGEDFSENQGIPHAGHLILAPDMNLPRMGLYVKALVIGVIASVGFFAFRFIVFGVRGQSRDYC